MYRERLSPKECTIQFTINIVLIILDASLGYHLAPRLYRHLNNSETDQEATETGCIRGMLSLMVALYMFFNCVAYYRKNGGMLTIVTIIVLADIAGQLYMRRRLSGKK